MKILAVDDEKKSLEAISDIVKEVAPDATYMEFDNSLSALAKAREEEFDVAFLDVNMPELSGIDLGKYLVELNPFINVIYLTEHKEFGYDAMQLHASGYILKPAVARNVKRELDALRYPELRKKYKRVFAQTFGNFELFVDGEPVTFKYNRTKEIVAVLINNKGAQTSNGELIACLWEDDGDPDKKLSYLCNLRQDLQNTFKKLKLDGIILKQRGSMAIAADKIECDLFDWLEKRKASKYQYMGDYMNQYSWPEFFHAELDEISYAMDEEE
ncbi:Two-component response regulator, SAPR family, consists of REC, wHTH and BTAD domains [Pseudobutyrivibrio sp. YE44]|uniref:response regulator n=1 Tax=Pseudobutyrivibrio sp. YE44 TaxID=1520802 RepID=UPI0008917749|nr:response regulator [Pseudobutyrivibrio sp. YE44]SDB05635.1 Two-component response regulator, SAPR family, consists of REC, wHTH and BTAD domains [Pseudobutyrivibrio sp. YE44]